MAERKNLIIIAAVAIVVVGIVLYLLIRLQAPAPSTVEAPRGGAPPAEEQSLGARVYEQTNNPVAEKIPEVNPAGNVNPLEDLYKNPF